MKLPDAMSFCLKSELKKSIRNVKLVTLRYMLQQEDWQRKREFRMIATSTTVDLIKNLAVQNAPVQI